MDDRKTKMLRDQRDRERREARAAAAARGEVQEPPAATGTSPIRDMPGTGQSLMPLQPDVTMDEPSAQSDDE